MGKTTKVILWGREDVIGQGVEYLLKCHTGWDVVRIPGDDYPCNLFDEIDRHLPEVVLIYEGNNYTGPGLALQILSRYPRVRVITFTLENCIMEIYDRNRVLVENAADFLNMVDGEPSPTG